jgi:hypothetical protein
MALREKLRERYFVLPSPRFSGSLTTPACLSRCISRDFVWLHQSGGLANGGKGSSRYELLVNRTLRTSRQIFNLRPS